MIDLILCFRWDALIELEIHYANRTFYVFFVLRIISGPRVTFVQCNTFKPPGSVYYWPFEGGGIDAVLILFSSVVYTTRRFMFGLALLFVYVFFSPFSILITLLGEEGAGLCAYRAFVY